MLFFRIFFFALCFIACGTQRGSVPRLGLVDQRLLKEPTTVDVCALPSHRYYQ